MDWIDGFMEYTHGTNSPDIFRLWAGISAISGTMERRIACHTAQGPIFANQFILFVATPGVGKTEAIKKVSKMWYQTTKLHVAPDSVTHASVIDSLVEADRKIIIPGDIMEYHSLNVAADEFGVFVPEYATDFLSKLTKLYDNPDVFRERRRHFNAGKEIQINQPQINILTGAQPGFLMTMLPEHAWSQGFMSRFILIYSDQKPIVDLFVKREENQALGKALVKKMAQWAEMMGNFTWDPGTAKLIQEWYSGGCKPVPEHSRLTHYNARRLVHCIKLCMVASLSRGDDLIITPDDFDRGLGWLLNAEMVMPDVFRAMEGRSDMTVLEDLHWFMHRLFASEKQKPIHKSTILNFLLTRTTSDKAAKILELAEQANRITRVAGTDLFTPRLKEDHGKE